jgi:Protein of unknown function (DUF2877)
VTTRSTMAVSMLCRAALHGPRAEATVAYRGHDAWLLTVPDSGRTVALMTPRAVLLPCSVVVSTLPTHAAKLSIGDGALWYDELPGAITRWFTPSRIRRGALREHATGGRQTAQALAGWRAQLGKGAGLTPYGDDVVCGLVLGLLATGSPDADRLIGEISQTDLEAGTTAVSAALLRCACAGWCIPEVQRLLAALATGRDIDQAVQALLRVGHSSGRGLLSGLGCALDVAPLGQAA